MSGIWRWRGKESKRYGEKRDGVMDGNRCMVRGCGREREWQLEGGRGRRG